MVINGAAGELPTLAARYILSVKFLPQTVTPPQLCTPQLVPTGGARRQGCISRILTSDGADSRSGISLEWQPTEAAQGQPNKYPLR